MLASMSLAGWANVPWAPVQDTLKRLGRAVGRDRLAVLSDGLLGDQIDTLPVVRGSFGRIGGNRFVKGHDGLIRLANIGVNRAHVEIVSSCARGSSWAALV